MGQAFRRAAGRIKPASSIDSSASSLKMESVVDRKPPPRAVEKARESGALDSGNCNLSIVCGGVFSDLFDFCSCFPSGTLRLEAEGSRRRII